MIIGKKIMNIQRKISQKHNQNLIGKTFKVLIDRLEGEYYVGRTEYDSPEIDNEVLIKKSKFKIKIGDFVRVKIADANEYDLLC